MPERGDVVAAGPSKVAITGSAGHLGREVTRQLRDAGTEVVALARDAASRARWSALCQDVDAVIHLAAPTSGVDAAAIDDALATTRFLFEALPSRPLPVVFAGSMALFKPPSDGRALDEDSAVYGDDELSAQDAYTRMKTIQEASVRAACEMRGDRLTVLRPSNVWDAERWHQSCIGPKAGPLWFVVHPGRRLRLIHRGNCARAFVDAVRTWSGRDALNVDDGADVSAWRYATRVAGWRRHRYLPVPVPGWLFDAAATVGARVLTLVAPNRRMPGLLIAQRRASRFGGHGIDTRRVRACIGWEPDLRFYEDTTGST